MEGESKTPKAGNQSVAPKHLTKGAYASGNGHEGSKASTGEGAQDKAEQVLEQYRFQFIRYMDAKAVTMELVHKDIITSGDESEILKNEDLRLQNQKLHSCLMNKCTKEALNTVCGVIMEVKGNPKMKAVGKDMKRSLSEGPDQAPDEPRGPQTEVIPKGVAGKQSGWSYFWNLVTSKRIIIASSLLMLALVVALICYYHYHTERKTYSGDYPNSQKDAFPFTDVQSTRSVKQSGPLTQSASETMEANPEEDNCTPNGPANKTSSEQLLLPPSDIMPLKSMPLKSMPLKSVPLKSMPCELQVISSVKKGNKLYITAIGIAQDKDSKDDVPKDHVSRQIQVYSLDGKGNWSTLPEDPRQKPAPNYNAPVTVINGRIALVGGRDAETGDITKVLSTWNEKKHEWEQDSPPSMPTKRLASGVCHRDNLLLVVGGVVDDKARMLVNTVDVYDFSSNRWYTPKALDLPITQLRSPNVVVFKEYVYVIGGVTAYPAPPGEAQYNRHAWRALWSDVKEAVSKEGAAVIQGAHTRGAEGEPSKEVESVWKRITDPPFLRPTVVSCEDFLMAVGGVKGGIPQEGIYKFMDGKNADSCGSWRLVGNMSVGRYRHAVVPLGSRGTAALFVAGGYVLDNPEGDETIIKSSSVEIVIL